MFYFISFEAQLVLRLLVSIKHFWQYKNDKFVRKRRTFHKIFCSMQNFLELQCLVDNLSVLRYILRIV